MNGSSISNSLVRIDGFVQSSSVEELRQQFLNLGDSGTSSDQDDVMDLVLGNLGVSQDLLDWLDSVLEVVAAEILKLGSGDIKREVLSVLQGINIDLGRVDSGQHSLGSLALSSESSQSLLIVSDVNTRGLLEMSNTVVDQSVVEILSSKMGVSGSSLDLEKSILNRK